MSKTIWAGSSTIAVATLLAAALVGPSPAFASDKCLNTLNEEGHKKPSQRAAHASAIHHWQHEAAQNHGRPYGDWRYSGERQISCTWAENGSWYQCTAAARPCARVR